MSEVMATGTFAAAPMGVGEPHIRTAAAPSSVEEARAEVNALAMHLEALMLTNKALLAQLAEAKRRAAGVESQLEQDAERAQQQRTAWGRRGRDEVDAGEGDDDEGDERPQYRSGEQNGMPPLTVLSSADAPPDEFEHGMPDDGSVTFRSTAADEKPAYGADDEWDGGIALADGGLQHGGQLHLPRLREVVAALGALAALGDGAKDDLGAQLAA